MSVADRGRLWFAASAAAHKIHYRHGSMPVQVAFPIPAGSRFGCSRQLNLRFPSHNPPVFGSSYVIPTCKQSTRGPHSTKKYGYTMACIVWTAGKGAAGAILQKIACKTPCLGFSRGHSKKAVSQCPHFHVLTRTNMAARPCAVRAPSILQGAVQVKRRPARRRGGAKNVFTVVLK